MALLLSRAGPCPVTTTNSCAPAFLFQSTPWVSHHRHEGTTFKRQTRRHHSSNAVRTSRRIFRVRSNSPKAASDSPEHNDAPLGTAGIDGYDRSNASIIADGNARSALSLGTREVVGVEGAGTGHSSTRIEFSKEKVATQEQPPSSPRTAAAVNTAEINGKTRIHHTEEAQLTGSLSAQPSHPTHPVQPTQQQRKEDYVVLSSESMEIDDKQDVGEAGEPPPGGGGVAGEFTDLDAGALAESYERGKWLLGLLVLQSTSSSVLDKYQDLLREHVVVTLFLTMLVGAGGNAGNQSAIKVIRGLATGRFTADAACAMKVIGEQAAVGFLLGAALAIGGFFRVWVTEGTTLRDASAISMSLFLIVMVSVLLGSALPFGFARAGVDPAHAGTSIQVAMDIVGVSVTCVTCSFVLTQLTEALSISGVGLPLP